MKICINDKSNYKVSMTNNQSFLKKCPQLLKLQMLKLSKDIKLCLMFNVINSRSSIKQYRVQFSSIRCG